SCGISADGTAATTDCLGTGGSKGSGYLDVTASFAVVVGMTLALHYRYQYVRSYAPLSYADYKIGLTRPLAAVTPGAAVAVADAVPGPTAETLGKIAKETGIVVIASLFERRAAGLYHNTAAVIDADGKVKGIYRKMHIPDDPAYYEKFYFTPGDLGFRAFDTK